MIAVSSFRPLDKCSPEIWQNQVNARKSWDKVFSKVIYFGDANGPLTGMTETIFVPCEDFPFIFLLAYEASRRPGWSCLINADIWLKPDFARVEAGLDKAKAQAAISSRCDMNTAKIIDGGLDIFMAKQEVWKGVADEIPQTFRIGHIRWDTWMVSFFANKLPKQSVFDITPLRLVFHPKHEERIRPYPVVEAGFPGPIRFPVKALTWQDL